jgi:hypothetical protein
MDNIQGTLLFPVRDAESRKQFLIACAVMLAGFIIPLLPSLLFLGYTAKIMRQIIEDRRAPSMTAWQGSDWTEMFLDGARLWGAQLVLMIPLLLLAGCGLVSMLGGSISISTLADKINSPAAILSMLFFMTGIFLLSFFGILSLPFTILVYASQPHVASKRSFQAVFEFKEWVRIFGKALLQFVLGYLIVMAASMVFILAMQVAMLTIVLLCIIPFLMIPYMAYQTLVMNAFFAQAYTVGRERLEAA